MHAPACAQLACSRRWAQQTSQLPAGQLAALKHGLVSNATLAGLGSSLLPDAGLTCGVTGYIMLPPQAFCFYNGVAASGVRPSCHLWPATASCA